MRENEGGAGLFSALAGIAATLLASGKTRLELLSNEIEAGKLRAIQSMLLALAMAFCFGVGILLTVILLATLFWEQRAAVLAIGALVFFAFGVILLIRFQREARHREGFFAASVAELEQDLQHWKAASGHEPDR